MTIALFIRCLREGRQLLQSHTAIGRSVLLWIRSLVLLELTFLRESERVTDAVHTQHKDPCVRPRSHSVNILSTQANLVAFFAVEESVAKSIRGQRAATGGILNNHVLSSISYSLVKSLNEQVLSRCAWALSKGPGNSCKPNRPHRASEKLRFMKGEAQPRPQICGCLDGRLGSTGRRWAGGSCTSRLGCRQNLPNTVRVMCDSEQRSAELEG